MAARAAARSVAVACQGGGSHSAFSAGVLGEFARHGDLEIVGLSGTSGGAINALLSWYGIRTGGGDHAAELLDAFWRDTAASAPLDRLRNAWLVALGRLEGAVALPAVSPYWLPRVAEQALAALIEAHVDFDRIAQLPRSGAPVLLVGAVDVLSGHHRVFDSRRGEITLPAMLASAAIPNLFRAVEVDGQRYWDGLFSQNPPIRDLPETGCDEIWILQINPSERAEVPRTVGDILDRRNELSGNLSLQQELFFIDTINRLVAQGDLVSDRYRLITRRTVALGLDLDLASKLDRSPDFLAALRAEGVARGREFLAALPAP